MVPHALNSTYSDGSSQILWENGERVFHRDWRLDDDGKRRAVLLALVHEVKYAEGLAELVLKIPTLPCVNCLHTRPHVGERRKPRA